MVATVSSDEKARLAAAAGAHHTVSYREGTRPNHPRGTIAAYTNNGADEVRRKILETFATNAQVHHRMPLDRYRLLEKNTTGRRAI